MLLLLREPVAAACRRSGVGSVGVALDAVERDDPGGADHRHPPRGGQWLDAGTAEVQLRVDQPAPATAAPSGAAVPQTGVQAHLITPDMTATPGTEAPRAGVATAATARPAIVSRRGWGAVESLRRAGPDYSSTVKAAVIHHTVQTNRYAPSESAALVRADYLYHVRSRGWNDIGYNFLVDRYGRVFVGSPHQGRGRTFKVVFVPALAERLFPQKPREDPMLLDEELRRRDPGARRRPTAA